MCKRIETVKTVYGLLLLFLTDTFIGIYLKNVNNIMN